jgi:hydroxymethylpyrimidine pyrophosphatase-like HAD family hydrolase
LKFSALATDYDGTIAQHGDVDIPTQEALRRWKDSGHKLILVTGRELPDLSRVCPFVPLFDRVVAENGALLYEPATGRKQILAAAPPTAFVDALRARGVTPLSIGKVIVATMENYRGIVLETIEEFELKFKVVPNKGAVMVLPSNIDKATGLRAALEELAMSLPDVVGIGDAENDLVFLGICGYSAAVANALSSLKRQVHFVTRSTHGAGVQELINKLLETDCDLLPARVSQLEFPETGESH